MHDGLHSTTITPGLQLTYITSDNTPQQGLRWGGRLLAFTTCNGNTIHCIGPYLCYRLLLPYSQHISIDFEGICSLVHTNNEEKEVSKRSPSHHVIEPMWGPLSIALNYHLGNNWVISFHITYSCTFSISCASPNFS